MTLSEFEENRVLNKDKNYTIISLVDKTKQMKLDTSQSVNRELHSSSISRTPVHSKRTDMATVG